MNDFIKDLTNDERYHFEEIMLRREGCIEFLKRINVTFATYCDKYNKYIAIKEKTNNYFIDITFDFDNDRFIKISKVRGTQGYSFEHWLGAVLINHFNPMQFNDLHIHWGSNCIEWEEK